MKTTTFTDFGKNALGSITEVEHGKTLVRLRRGNPMSEIILFFNKSYRTPLMEAAGNPFANPTERLFFGCLGRA